MNEGIIQGSSYLLQTVVTWIGLSDSFPGPLGDCTWCDGSIVLWRGVVSTFRHSMVEVGPHLACLRNYYNPISHLAVLIHFQCRA